LNRSAKNIDFSMKALQITLFIIGNVLFFGQLGRDVHHLIWGAETSVFDEFAPPARTEARSERSSEALLADYRKAGDEIKALENGKSEDEVKQLKRDNEALYDKRNESRSELAERERNSRELRDLWAYSGYGLVLIFGGFLAFRGGRGWVGMALAISGFTILEYWASPPIFGGAYEEFRTLLWSKTALTAIALILLYASTGFTSRYQRATA
jgi:hypothetical protein